MPAGDKKPRGKPAHRWNVQPLRELRGEIYPTPPTESIRKSGGEPRQKTKRRRPPRPSKG